MILDSYMALLRTVIPWMVIPAFDNGPRPAKPYLSVSLLTSGVSGVQYGRVVDVDRRNYQHRMVTMRAEIFGATAWDIASALSISLFDEQNIDVAAEVYEIAWMHPAKIFDVPQLLDTSTGRGALAYEPRIVLEMPSCYTASHIEHVGAIETVEGEMNTTPGTNVPRYFIAEVVI